MKVALTIVDHLRRAEQVYGDRVAVIDETDQPAESWGALTYKEVARRARAQAAGLDVEQLVSVISQGAASSWQMVNRSSTMARNEFDFGFAVESMRKDLGFYIEEAQRNGASLPVTTLVDSYYAEVEARGGKRWDTSSLISLLRK